MQLSSRAAVRVDIGAATGRSYRAVGTAESNEEQLLFHDRSTQRARDTIRGSTFPEVDTLENFRQRHESVAEDVRQAQKDIAADRRIGLAGYVGMIVQMNSV